MNGGMYGFPKPENRFPVLVGATTVTDSSSIAVPNGVQNGDTLILAIGQRNGTYALPSGGWRVGILADASSAEYNIVWLHTAQNEPTRITITYSGNQSAVLAAFRSPRPLNIFDYRYGGATEQAPAVLGKRYGVFLGFAFDALSSTHVTGFTGLTTIARAVTGNAAACMAYRYTEIDNVFYGPYPATPTGAAYDGYASLLMA